MSIKIQIPSKFQFLFQPKRYKVMYGGRGGGKSHAIARTLLVMGMQNPLRIICAREIQKSISDSVHALLSDLIREHAMSDFYEVQRDVIRGKNGTEFKFRGLKHNTTDLKSLEGADICWVEEGQNVSDNSWEILVPTIRKEGSEIWVSYNPKNVTDPTHKRFVMTQSDDTIAIKIGWQDNPFFPAVLDKERRKLEIADPDAYAHIWEGMPDTRRNGSVYARQIAKAREEGRITKVPYDPGAEVFTAWDLGFGDATSIWWLQFVGRELRWLEYYENAGEQLDHYAKVVKIKPYNYAMHGHFLPHDGGHGNIRGDSVSKQLIAMGLSNTVLTRESDITPGIETLRQTITYSVFDADKCREGLHALENYGYEWDEDRSIFKAKPRHDWTSHCFVGSTEVLTPHGTQRIMDLPKTGKVLTLCGWKTYHNPRITRKNAPLVEVVFKGGFTVKCTPDHLFLTEQGWKSADSLKKGFLIQSSLIQSRNSLTENFIKYGLQVIDILNPKNIFTVAFGKMRLEKFRMDAISITGMGTGQTMPYQTLSVWTPRNTLALLGTNTKNTLKPISQIAPDKRPKNGISQTKDGCGISAKQNDSSNGQNGKDKASHAYIAEQSLWRWLGNKVSISFATLIAKPLIIENIKHLPATETEDVWCLTVPAIEHFSLSNGAVVHNCADAARYAAIAAGKQRGAIVKVNDPFAHQARTGWMG